MFQAFDMTISGKKAFRMTIRRIIFASLLLVSFVGLAALMTVTLSPGGYSSLDIFILVCFMVTLPWTIIGFWNAVQESNRRPRATSQALQPIPVATGSRHQHDEAGSAGGQPGGRLDQHVHPLSRHQPAQREDHLGIGAQAEGDAAVLALLV